MSKRTRGILVVIGVLVLLGIVGRMDYEDAKREEAHYCQMVRDGFWPDFRETYATTCARP